MTEQEQVEAEIRALLASETSGIALGNKLFSPDGLFNKIAKNEADRRQIIQTPLFREAHRHYGELVKREAAEFSRVADQMQTSLPPGKYRIRLEPLELPLGPDR